MDSESATPVEKASSPSPSKSPSETPAPAPAPPAAAALSDTSDSDSDDDDAIPEVEWLATGRQRRSTAGNRMKSMLAAEEPDDDLELLFAEDDNDQGFSDGGDDGSDVHMDSSSDDEDNNNNATAADDLEGEKELERQAKEKRAAQRKRKAQDAHIPAKFRKKVRINTEAPPPRPKKKSERASWLPSPADLPTRASSRSTTRLSKEQLHSQMVEREARRLKQVAQMQKKAAKLEAMRKPPMTQEERLREAEKVEQRNRGSLNRWEEAERAREEDRLRKLKALTERRLEGPVITFWSGVREGQVKYVEMEEKPVRKKREKPAKAKGPMEQQKDGEEGNNTPKAEGSVEADKDAATKAVDVKQESGASATPSDALQPTITEAKDGDAPQPEPDGKSPETGETGETRPESAKPPPDAAEEAKNLSVEPSPAPPTQQTESASEATSEKQKTPAPDKLEVMPQAEAEDPPRQTEQPDDAPTSQAPPAEIPLQDQQLAAPDATQSTVNAEPKPSAVPEAPALAGPHQNPTKAESSVLTAPDTTQDCLPTSRPAEPAASSSIPLVVQPAANEATTNPVQSEQLTPKPEETGEDRSAVTEKAPRNAIIFQNFNENVIKDKSIQTQILFGQKMAKLSKPAPSPVCVITNRPARYRDPSTGLPFATSHAYHEIRRLIRGDYKWSRLLGAWVGTGTYAARGVPERFLNPDAKSPAVKKKEEEEERKKAEEAAAAKKETEAASKPAEEDKQKKIDDPVAPPTAATEDVAMVEAPTVTV